MEEKGRESGRWTADGLGELMRTRLEEMKRGGASAEELANRIGTSRSAVYHILLESGTIVLKKDYVADWMRVVIANRAGDVIREIVFKDVMLKGSLEGLDELDYSSNEPQQLSITFVSDWWKEFNA